MDDAARELLRELAEWRPRDGLVSVYLDIDPADRGAGWRIELEQGLREIANGAAGGAANGLAAATERILARFPADAPHPSGRAQVGFVEADGDGRDVWHGLQMRLDRTQVTFDQAPALLPLVRLVERGAPVGVVLLASERARALEWARGRLEELGDWEMEVTSYDWRERKAPRRNPASGTGVSSAGRDQHEQRLESSRARFLKQLGGRLADRFGERGWRRILVFAEGALPDLLAAGLGPQAELVHQVRSDLIRAETPEIAQHVEQAVAELNRERERDLLAAVDEALGADPGVAAGPQEVLAALEQGRARHLVLDPAREFEPHDGRPGAEAMVALALTTAAEITPVEREESTARLAEREGVVALLRY